MKPTLNKRFNRLETDSTHLYLVERGGHLGTEKMKGRIKCKLLHGKGFSVIAPDQLYIQNLDTWYWFQPLSFLANTLVNLGDSQEGLIPIDVSARESVLVHITSKDFLGRLDDGSELYDCTIDGTENLLDYATGKATFGSNYVPRLQLYHFTTEETKQRILESEHFRPSSWNIQGNKKLVNVGYAYFTCLEAITTDGDLNQIAMAADAVIHLMTDQIELPRVVPPHWMEKNKANILEILVYRESTKNRTGRLDVSIEATALAPQPVHMHTPVAGAVYYNVSHPFIYRVGLPPGGVLKFTGNWIPGDQDLKRFEYVVMGDARTLEGLGAPYDEENTLEKFLIQNTTGYSCMLEYWFKEGNKDLVSGRKFEEQLFQK